MAPALKTILGGAPTDEILQQEQSPIFELIGDLSRTMNPGDKAIFISDMLQNSPNVKPFCQVKGALPAYAAYSNWPVYKALLRPERLTGIDVEVLFLQRPSYGKYCTERELLKFWRDFFVDNGVPNPRFIRIRNGGGQ